MQIDEHEAKAASAAAPAAIEAVETLGEAGASEQASTEESAAESAEPGPTVGALLADARQQLGLSIADVSARLRLTEHFVRSLEAGDYGKLPGEVYAVGYLRNYCALLGLDPEHVLELYRRSGVRAFAPRPQQRLPSARSSFNWLLPVLLIVLLGAAVAVGWWLFQSFGQSFGEGLFGFAAPWQGAGSELSGP